MKCASGPKIFTSGLKRTCRAAPVVHGAQVFQLRDRRAAFDSVASRDCGRARLRPRAIPTARSRPRSRRRAGRRWSRKRPPVNLPPECSVVMMISSADFDLNFGCGSTGMPRPLSRTVKTLSGLKLDLDAAGVARDRFVHRVVDDLGGEDDAARARPCRRYTCPAAGGRAQALQEPRCPWRNSRASSCRLCPCRKDPIWRRDGPSTHSHWFKGFGPGL